MLAAEAAPAKVNLALHVVGRRADGFHDLESLVVFADVADELECVRADADSLTLKGPFAEALTTGQSNLVLKAVAAFRARWPEAVPHGVAIELTKNLPVAAGIGGGSADAAAALRLMANVTPDPIDMADLTELAGSLGADVPVCLVSRPCLVSGIGKVNSVLTQFPACHIVMVNPLIPVATADIFRRLEHHANSGLPPLPEAFDRVAMLGLWLQETRNDLEPPARAVAPVIGDIVTAIGATRGCVAARMSGSGATVFGLYGAAAEAHQAARDLRQRWPGYWVAAAPVQ